jgi:hypothetical protein
MTHPTKNQRDLLQIAASSEGGVADAPREAAVARQAKTLIHKGLMLSLPVDGDLQRLLITKEGRAAIGVEEAAAPASPAPQAEPSKGKLAVLIDLLRRPQGATIADLTAATGWQAHSVRGAIAGAIKKQRGLQVSSTKPDNVRIYRIVELADAG